MLLTDSDPKHTFPAGLDLKQVSKPAVWSGCHQYLSGCVDCASPVNSGNLCMNHSSFVNCSTIIVFL